MNVSLLAANSPPERWWRQTIRPREYGIKRLNHGIGFNTAAIELILPTYAEKLGLKGKIATHWALNPQR
jgi:hypothetical protein